MSNGWGKGSTRAWRRVRDVVLRRDGYRCQIRIRGACTETATVVHHKRGKAAGDDPAHLEAACWECNNRVGDPTAQGVGWDVVAYVRTMTAVPLRVVMARWPDVDVKGVLRRAVRRGEVVHLGRGSYGRGAVDQPPRTVDPQPKRVTRW